VSGDGAGTGWRPQPVVGWCRHRYGPHRRPAPTLAGRHGRPRRTEHDNLRAAIHAADETGCRKESAIGSFSAACLPGTSTHPLAAMSGHAIGLWCGIWPPARRR